MNILDELSKSNSDHVHVHLLNSWKLPRPCLWKSHLVERAQEQDAPVSSACGAKPPARSSCAILSIRQNDIHLDMMSVRISVIVSTPALA